jgi:ribulose-phosphate 3-epimerase
VSERVLIAPSILSADFGALREDVAMVEAAGADMIHVDVMDGHFVPNLTIGPPVVKALKRCTDLPLDVHLMIENPDETIDWYLDAGADYLTVHVEACTGLQSVVGRIREGGARAGVSLNPDTPVETLGDIVGEIDMVLVMSVNPGFGGQSFIPGSSQKLSDVAGLARERGSEVLIAVDGGIDATTASEAVGGGARMLIAGSAVFCADDPATALRELRSVAEVALG